MSHQYLNGVIKKVAPASYMGTITPYTTVISQCTITSAQSTPVTSLATVVVLISYPDNTIATYTQANGDAIYIASGMWQLTYNTKSTGNYQELWVVTTATGDTTEFKVTYAVKQ